MMKLHSLDVRLGDRMRSIVRGSPFLYVMHLRLFRDADDVRLPRRGDVLHLTGFPRSANTHAMYIVQAAAPTCEQQISTHSHVPASIRMALSLRIPTVVLIREPLETVASRLVMMRASPRDTAAADALFAYYQSYYTFVQRNLERLTIVDFLTVTERPAEFLEITASAAPGLVVVRDISGAIERARILHNSRNEERLPQDRTIPDTGKRELKHRFRDLLRSRPAYERVAELYGRLSPRK